MSAQLEEYKKIHAELMEASARCPQPLGFAEQLQLDASENHLRDLEYRNIETVTQATIAEKVGELKILLA